MISLGINIHHKNPTLTAKVGRIMKEVTGAWYDPLLPYLYDTSTGVAQVDAAEDPIGLMIDRRLGAGLGAELASYSQGATVASLGTATVTGLTIISEKGYFVTIPSGLRLSGPSGFPTYVSTGAQFFVVANASGSFQVYNPTGSGIVLSYVSVKLLDGNHAIQATAAARPTYRLDANGRPYAAFLGTDDNMTCSTGGGGTTGFYIGCAIVLTGGAGTAREIYSDSGTNTGIHVEVDAANKLSMSAGNGVAFTTLASTAALSVGTKYILEAYITGGVMYVQINGATAESVAAPTITAGSAGFTIGKDNLLASDFMIGNMYSLIYAKNTGLTSAQRATNLSYLRSRIGL